MGKFSGAARFLQRIFAYGCAGILIETFFTGFYQAIHGSWRLSTQSFIWMAFVYGVGGILYDVIRGDKSPLAMAFIYTPLIYLQELLWGLLFRNTLGDLWNYGHHWWTPMGLINFKYAPFWFLVSYFFVPTRTLLRHYQQLVPFK